MSGGVTVKEEELATLCNEVTSLNYIVEHFVASFTSNFGTFPLEESRALPDNPTVVDEAIHTVAYNTSKIKGLYAAFGREILDKLGRWEEVAKKRKEE